MASNLWSEEHLICPVCMEILKDPVTIPCGHSYCMGCIKNYWDQTDHTGVYSCPQCRKTFAPRSDLGRNTILTEVVEKLKKTGLKPPPAQSYAGPGDVPCDVCTGRKFKAVKSCLTCLASYCETHIKPHSEVTPLQRHKLINAIGNLEQKLCAEHQRLCEVFCRTDQMCICLLCTDKEHKSHDTVSAETELTGKQKQLGETQTEIQQRIQERLKEVEELKQAVESLKRSAHREIKESAKIFTELIRSIEKIHTEVIELIGANEKAAVNQTEGLVKKLEKEIAELINRNTELKQLSETEDHIHFLQNFQSLCAPPEAGDIPSITVNRDISFGALRKAVSELKDHIEDFCKGELVKITKTVNEVAVYSLQAPEPRNRAEFLKSKEKCEEELKDQPESQRRRSIEMDRPSLSGCEASAEEETGETEEQEPVNEVAVYSLQAPEPRNRTEFLKYSCQLTLDPNTVHRQLCLSEGNRKVTRRRETQRYPDHPERFDMYAQVLCREGLSGTRCYWEIECSRGWAYIGVTYKGINRKGGDDSCRLGRNDNSWSLDCSGSGYYARHNNNETAITAPRSPRIGVYLDFNAGTLSFHGISDTMTLLHRFQTTFTEPLYPGFRLCWYDSPATICQLN